MGRNKKSVTEKVQAEYPDFATEVEGLSVEQLNSRLASLAKMSEETESAMDKDAEYQDAKSLATELAGPYRDTKKAIKLKSKYVYSLLKEKGAGA